MAESTTTTTLQQVTDITVFFVQQVGAELIIFAVTALIAVVFQAGIVLPRQQQQQQQQREQQQPQSTPRFSEKPSGKAALSCKSLVASTGARAPAPKELAKLLDGIVETMRGRPAQVAEMQKALESYRRLQQHLRMKRACLSEITGHARYTGVDLYTAMVQCVTRTQRSYLVEQLLDDMNAQAVPRSLSFYEGVLKQLAGQKQYDMALSVYDRMAGAGLTPSPVTISCLVSFAAEAGQYRRAVQFFEQLSALTKPSIRAWMTLLRVHNKQHNWAASSQAFQNMQQQGVVVDTLALNVVLSTAVACDKIAEAEAFLNEIELSSPAVPDVVTFNTLIKGYMQRGEIEEAMSVLDRMQAHGVKPNSISFSTILNKVNKVNHAEQISSLMEKMASLGNAALSSPASTTSASSSTSPSSCCLLKS